MTIFFISNTRQDYKFDLKVLEITLGKLEKNKWRLATSSTIYVPESA